MKILTKKIKQFKLDLDELFEDKFAIKNDPANKLLSRISRKKKNLENRLWYK